jgi:3-deoxy-7-phosphoheptulonate synthase
MSASLADLDFGAAGLANPERQANSPADRVRLAGILTSGATASCERGSIYACRKFLLTSFSSSRERNMIVITQPNATEEQIQRIITRVREFGLEAQISRGASRVIIGVIGPEALLREKAIAAMPGVEAIVPVLKPYKLAARDSRGASSVAIGDVRLGEHEDVVLICGPCSVESKEQILSIATIVKDSGARILRGGAFKPRTSPYSFQGLREEGLRFLAEARAKTGLPVVTEVMDPRDLPMIEKYADCLQVGTRNMHNFSLLKEVGRSRLPVLLKRGFSATIYDLIMSAEYILNEGNPNVVLCERGIRTFDNAARYTLDLSAVPILKSKTHLPVIVDPTHALGLREFVPQMSLAAVAAGADALMIEVHYSPEQAKSDGNQALTPEIFAELVPRLRAVAAAIGREM